MKAADSWGLKSAEVCCKMLSFDVCVERMRLYGDVEVFASNLHTHLLLLVGEVARCDNDAFVGSENYDRSLGVFTSAVTYHL